MRLTSGLGYFFTLQRLREAKPPVQRHTATLGQDWAGCLCLGHSPRSLSNPAPCIFLCYFLSDPCDNPECQVVALPFRADKEVRLAVVKSDPRQLQWQGRQWKRETQGPKLHGPVRSGGSFSDPLNHNESWQPGVCGENK